MNSDEGDPDNGIDALFSADDNVAPRPADTDRATSLEALYEESEHADSTTSRDKARTKSGNRPQHWWSPLVALAVIGVLVAGGVGIGAAVANQMQQRRAAAAVAGLDIDSPASHSAKPRSKHTVVLRVVGHGKARVSYVTFIGSKSVTTSPTLVTLPWNHKVTVSKKNMTGASFTVTGHNYTSTKKITVSIEVDGKQISTASRSGQYALVSTTKSY